MRKIHQPGRGPQRSAAKERFWRGHVARQKAGRMSVRDYCARHALSEPSFYAWRAELARRDKLQRASGSAPQRPPTPPALRAGRFAPQFVRLDLQPAAGTGLIEIVLGSEGLGGAVVRVPQGADRATLEGVLAALAAALRASASSASEGLPC
jgi:hypothetical protein